MTNLLLFLILLVLLIVFFPTCALILGLGTAAGLGVLVQFFVPIAAVLIVLGVIVAVAQSSAKTPAAKPGDRCLHCLEPLAVGARWCPLCGTERGQTRKP